VIAILAVHLAAIVWLCGDTTRLRLLGYDFIEVSSEALVNGSPDVLRPLGFTEDDPSELAAFRTIAARVVGGSSNDGEKLRRLGDYIYSLRRPGAPDLAGERDTPLSVAWANLQRGEHGDCATMSALLAVFWRSLGGHARAVRWANAEGRIGHSAVELYSDVSRHWMYYDMNLNGYGEDETRTPLSIAALRSNLLTDEDVHLVANPQLHDWSSDEFQAALGQNPVEWYVLNNRVLYFEPERRFGRLHQFGWLLSRLPAPLDRGFDNVVGDRDRRLVIQGKIQVADLFTFNGARWFLAYLSAVIAVCGITLVHARVRRKGHRQPHDKERTAPGGFIDR
jgi:hypothetical protein